MRRRPRIVALVGAALVALATVAASGPAANAAPVLTPRADILVDATSGRVLAGDHIHDAIHTASTAKIMTALTGVERLAPDAPVTACPNTAAIETNKIGFPAGTQWPLDEMLTAMMMVSANDAAYAVACTIEHGNLDAFAADLNATAHRLGLQDSTLGDPAGLDDATSYKGGPTMSAYDLAVATRNALTVPAIAKWAATHQYSFVDPQGVQHSLINHNKMLPGAAYAYPGATGFKTGFTKQAQHSLVATATRNGRTLIAVILGAPDSGYAEAASLFDAGFAMAPEATGTGVTLPPVAVSPYGARAADVAAFAKLGSASAVSGTAGATVPAEPPVYDAPPRPAPVHTAAATTTTRTKHHSSVFSLRNLFIVFVLLGGALLFLRRRAVKRQRAVRAARRRQRAAAMRSGGLPVVDGRYRTGLRVGPPVESHVRVRRLEPPQRQTGTA